ncbi:hypothetical protein D5086_018963 [Populus alba]|uniref:Uncharacterized protein n=1 Tax=Populus alba TaxID=43335 RepID=A0ACC4BG98_POPAL
MVVETTLKMMILRMCDYLEMQCYEGEDEVEIFGVIRNTSTVKTKLSGGVLKEDLKIELPRQFRKLKSITQVDGDLGFRKSGTLKKNPVVPDGGFSLRERELEAVKTSRGINLECCMVALEGNINDEMAKWAVKNLNFSVKQPLMR